MTSVARKSNIHYTKYFTAVGINPFMGDNHRGGGENYNGHVGE